MEDIVVSIICNAFNHEPYIRDALEGFVHQKTNFPFEILVHDDASTDHTADIIREYEQKYPEIIKPIYETENQYSKKDGSLARIQYGRVKGKYIAMCEGDDYWTDPLKLQKQVDALEAHPKLDICATAAKIEKDGMISGQVSPSTVNIIFSTEQVIDGGGGFVATASLLYRREILDNPLPFFRLLWLDYSIQILGSLRGGMLYLVDQTCVYRIQTPGSWTNRTYHNIEAMNQFQKRLCDMLRCLDQDTSGKYHAVIEQKIGNQEFSGFYRNQDYKSMCLPEYRERLLQQPFKRRMLIYSGRYFPKTVKCILDFIGGR